MLGFGGSVQLTRRAGLRAGVDTLLDRNYSLVDGYPEEGRNAYVNLRFRF